MGGETLVQSARNALYASMKDDQAIVVLGEDARSGGPFGLTKGLFADLGSERVRNTPISEASFVGVGVGLALGGARPFVDVMFDDFLTLASDQLFNQACKIHFMSGGRYSVPITLWTVGGAGTRWGAQHSQRLDGLLTSFPGLKVMSPSSPKMMYSSMREALADPDPVVVLVDRALLYSSVELPCDQGSPWEPRIVAEGESVTVVATGRLTHMAIEVAKRYAGEVEVIDLQRLSPLDVSTVVRSVNKTGKALLVHDEASDGGFTAGLAMHLYDQAYWSLDSPISHVTSPFTPVPAAPNLEDAFMVDAARIDVALRELLAN